MQYIYDNEGTYLGSLDCEIPADHNYWELPAILATSTDLESIDACYIDPHSRISIVDRKSVTLSRLSTTNPAIYFKPVSDKWRCDDPSILNNVRGFRAPTSYGQALQTHVYYLVAKLTSSSRRRRVAAHQLREIAEWENSR